MQRPLLAFSLILVAAAATAQTQAEIGARALGMGGAFLAVADGPTAIYWNPAALPLRPQAGAFVWGEDDRDPEELATRVDALGGTNALDPSIITRPTDGFRAVSLLGDIAANPVPIQSGHVLGAFYSHQYWGFSLHRQTLSEVTPIVDLRHTELSLDPLSGLPYNESRLDLRSLEVDDLVLSLATDLGDARVLVGGNVRYSHGNTFLARPSLFSFAGTTATDLIDLANEGAKTSGSAWSFDVASLISFHPKFRAGIVGRYLGSPEFDLADSTHLQLDPAWRTGVALFPAPNVVISADLDLDGARLSNTSAESRDFAIGGQVSFAGGKGALRAGYRTRVDGPEATLYSFGAGLVSGGFRIDGAVGISPSEGSQSFAVEIGFGQKEAQQAPVPPPTPGQ